MEPCTSCENLGIISALDRDEIVRLRKELERAEADCELLNQMVTRCNAAEAENEKLKEMLNAII